MVFRMKNYTISEFYRLDKTKLNGCYRVDGVSNWYKDGKLHREDGPAVRLRDGKVFYYFDNVKILSKEVLDILVRNKDNILQCSKSTSDEQYLSDGLHHVKYNQSDYFVFIKNGKRHNDDGPAFICNNVSYWKNGKLHREDGPAVECDMDPCQYFLNGIEYNKEEFYKKIMNKKNPAVKEKVYTVEEFNRLPINERTGCLKHSSGDKRWFKEGKLHREGGPAIEFVDGEKRWFKEGKLHREDGPAIEWADGYKEFWLKDVSYSSEKGFKQALAKLNKNKPVIKENVYTVEEFFKLPVNKRTGCVKYSNGDKRWLKRGKLHREDGPAIENINGFKYWYKEGKLHREDGPAIESANKIKEWWFNGEKFSESEFKRKLAQEFANKDKPAVEGKILTSGEFNKLPVNKRTGCVKCVDGDKFWYKEGLFHREDGPAFEFVDGFKEWYKEGKLHREDGPAREYTDGSKEWYKEGKLHREDGPAIEFVDGTKKYWLNGVELSESNFKSKLSQLNKKKLTLKEKVWTSKEFDKFPIDKRNGKFIFDDGDVYWYKEGLLHREDGPAIERANGYKEWYKEDLLHREDGPAIEHANGDKHWYKEGKLHREDGPAIEYVNGCKEYWLEGKKLSKKAFDHKSVKNKIKVWSDKEFDNEPNKNGFFVFEDDSKRYYKNGELHHLDGPAYTKDNESQYWIDGIHLTKEQFFNLKNSHNPTHNTVTNNDSKKEVKMTENNFLSMIKSDGENALYRVAATQMNKAVKNGIIKLMQSKGADNERIKNISEILDTEIGSALVAAILGTALTYAPKISEDPRAKKLAEEFRIKSMETIGNEVVGAAIEHLLPEVMSILSTLPEHTTRLAETIDHAHTEDVEETVTTKKINKK